MPKDLSCCVSQPLLPGTTTQEYAPMNGGDTSASTASVAITLRPVTAYRAVK
jgi:hypothetical protein